MSQAIANKLDLPKAVEDVLHRFYTAEVTTIGKDRTPVTWPVVVQYREDRGDFLFCTSIGMPGKVFNIRRDNRVSLSYSDPTGSGLTDPPRVVVQGRAILDDQVRTSVEGVEDFWVEKVMGPQPSSKLISSSALMRWYMDIYYMRVYITVEPVRICWWEDGDYCGEMQSIKVYGNVG